MTIRLMSRVRSASADEMYRLRFWQVWLQVPTAEARLLGDTDRE
jgi:hypothetical protein